MRKAVIYARASTTEQDQSCNQQIEECTKFAANQELEVVEIFRDDGVSGTSEDRAGFQALLNACKTRKDFSVVVVYDISRWGRFLNAVDSLYYRIQIEKTGKQFCTVKDARIEGIMGDFKNLMDAYAASEESRKRSSTVRRGMKGSIKQSERWPAKAPYGYRKDAATGKLVLGPEEEIKAVKFIFAHGEEFGVRKIASLLNEHGFKPPKSDQWNFKTVYNILHNVIYGGVCRWTDSGGRYESGVLDSTYWEVPAIMEVNSSATQTLIPT